jgi:ACT domain-containing protein
MLAKMLDDFKKFENEQTLEYEKSKEIQKNYSLILEQAKAEFAKIGFFKRLFASGDKRDEIKNLSDFITKEKEKARQTVTSIANRKLNLYEETVNQFINENESSVKELKTINDRISYISKIYNTFAKTVKAGDFAISEIKDAISAVDSAQSTETLDLFTNNKAISLMSSMSNSSARDESASAAHAVKKFKKELEYTKVVIGEMELDTSWGTFDFVVDMMSDGGFLDTFGSFMALSALNDAEENLKEAKREVSKVLDGVKKEFSEITKQKDHEDNVKSEFLKNYRIKAKMYLKENGIDI